MSVSEKVRELVKERDNYSCVGCGQSVAGRMHSLQHRRARKAGGARISWIDQPQNLVTLCGSATSPHGCHLRVEQRPEEAQDLGYVISEWPEMDPRFIPVHVVTEFGTSKVWLTPEGGVSDCPPAGPATFRDLLFCQDCRVVKLHDFDGDTAVCHRCGGARDLDPHLLTHVIEMRRCVWCGAMKPVDHACQADSAVMCESPWPSGRVCGICSRCIAAQGSVYALGGPGDLSEVTW